MVCLEVSEITKLWNIHMAAGERVLSNFFDNINITLLFWEIKYQKEFWKKENIVFLKASLILLIILIIMWGFLLNTFHFLLPGRETAIRNHWLSGFMIGTSTMLLGLMILMEISWEQLILLIRKADKTLIFYYTEELKPSKLISIEMTDMKDWMYKNPIIIKKRLRQMLTI